MLRHSGYGFALFLMLTVSAASAQVSMRGTVWEDLNADGLRDAGESALSGWTIYLDDNGNGALDGGESSQTTDSSGRFDFKGLPAGTYTVRQVDQASWVQTSPAGGAHSVTLADLELGDNLNFGNRQVGSISGLKWNDQNGDGTKDAGEPVLSGWTIFLDINSNGVLDGGDVSEVTDSNGEYTFANQSTKTFTVAEVAQTGWTQTFPSAGTHSVTVIAGQDVGSINFGNTQAQAAVGDFVWNDADGDGQQGGSEMGVENVTVRLWSFDGSTDTERSTTTTASDGSYSFTGLPAGTYKISIDLPSGFILADNLTDPSLSAVNSDVVESTGKTAAFTLASAEVNNDIDVGIEEPASLGDLVWNDLNGDGIQDSGEPGIENVTVHLIVTGGATIESTRTDNDGLYSFTDLRSGSYGIKFEAPSGFTFTQQDAGSDDSVDSDPFVGPGTTGLRLLLPGQTDTSVDAGLIEVQVQAAIGDLVWEDADGNGLQGASESGMAGVTVRLWSVDSSGETEVSSTISATDGSYSFAGIDPGDYKISVDVPTGYILADHVTGLGLLATNSDINTTTGKTATITLTSGEANNDIDIGLELPLSLGDRVWLDSDGDGIQDGSEPGVENVTVHLRSITGTVLQTTTTDASGNYIFSDLRSAAYAIRFIAPSNFGFTTINVGSDDTVDSDASASSGLTSPFIPLPGQNDMSIDAGLIQASIGDFVWEDADGDGLQGSSEIGMGGVTVRLWSVSGSVDTEVSTTTSAADGSYSFRGLSAGDYKISVDVPTGYLLADRISLAAQAAVNSDINLTTGKTATITLASGEVNNDVDVGLELPVSLGDRVWLDMNQNGIQDSGEPGVENVTVNLRNATGTVLETTTTDVSGIYAFSSLRSSTYAIRFIAPEDFTFTTEDAGTDDSVDSDASVFSGLTPVVFPQPGQNNLTLDAGLTAASIGDYIWEDADGNGRQDAGESGVAGVTVRLWSVAPGGDTELATTTSASDGSYFFAGLIAGDYKVSIDVPSGYLLTNQISHPALGAINSDIVLSIGTTATIALASGEINNNIDVGLVLPISLGDRVWHDLNGDGNQDGSEPGVENVTVNLRSGSGTIIESTTTDVSGNYAFSELRSAAYSIRFDLPANYSFTTQNVGTDDALDSDANVFSGLTALFSPAPGENDTTIDAGLVQTTIGDYIWIDSNEDGIQNGPEVGLEGATVRLWSASPGGDTELSTTTSASDGSYSFTGLSAGDYKISVDLPTGYLHSDNLTDPSLGSTNSDIVPSTGKTETITLASAEINNDIDVGVIVRLSLGDRVWHDLDYDGIQDPGEPGLENVTVSLRSSTGLFIAGTTTDASGNYLFSDLPMGLYVLDFNRPVGFTLTQQDAGTDDTLDSDATYPSGQTAPAFPLSLPSDLSIDAGYFQPVSIGDFVWIDVNQDGHQDASEPGFEGVTVRLFSVGTAGDTEVATTTTNNDGDYSFSRLIPGDYKISVDIPAGFVLSPHVIEEAGSELNSDIDPLTLKTEVITLSPGQTSDDIDVGLFSTLASVGNLLWFDENGNGLQDLGEAGMEGMTVELLTMQYAQLFPQGVLGIPIASTQTDANGNFHFYGLEADDYRLSVSIPGFGLVPTQHISDPASSAINSDLIPAIGRTEVFTLTEGETNNDIDIGLTGGTNAIGDRVWRDLNRNGEQDVDEPGVPGATVQLWEVDSSGDLLVRTTYTGPNGEYQFTNLAPDEYKVSLPVTRMWESNVSSFDLYTIHLTQASAQDINSDVDPVTGKSQIITVSGEETLTSVDIGVHAANSVFSGFIWDDLNGDGLRGAGEPRVDGVMVQQFGTGSSSPIAGPIMWGNEIGRYYREVLVQGEAYVVVTPPAGYGFTTQVSDPLLEHLNSDIDPATGQSAPRPFSLDSQLFQTDVGLVSQSTISGTVWVDYNLSNARDPSEPGLASVTVTLLNNALGTTETAVTDTDGMYSFQTTLSNNYIVTVSLPSGMTFVLRNQGGDDSVDSDVVPQNGEAGPINLDASTPSAVVDAGVFGSSMIGNDVWHDLDRDGIRQLLTSPPVENVLITLRAGCTINDPVVATVLTNASGQYSFNGIPAGSYTVHLTYPEQFGSTLQNVGPAGTDSEIALSPQDETSTSCIVLADGENNSSIDMGLAQTILGDLVWHDQDRDGVQDAGEPGIENVEVRLFGCATATACTDLFSTVYTDASGHYEAALPYAWNGPGAPAGGYELEVVPPTGFAITASDQTGDLRDSDFEQGTGRARVSQSFFAGSAHSNFDAGLTDESVVSGFAYNDLDNNGSEDGGDTRASGITLRLHSRTADISFEQSTDSNGQFEFHSLPPDTYDITVALPGNLVVSDASPVLVGSDAILTGVEVSLVAAASIGSFVWHDANRDGIQNGSELGVADFELALEPVSSCPASGNAQGVFNATTSSSGDAAFLGLSPGSYRLFVQDWQRRPLPGYPDAYVSTEYGPTIRDQGTDTEDSDHPGWDEDGGFARNICLTLEPGDNRTDVDVGLVRAVVGDYVWIDTNGNGQQDSGEPGLPGVTISLETSSSSAPPPSPVLQTTNQTTISDANGWYEFELPLAGHSLPTSSGDFYFDVYQLTFITPSGYAPSPAGQASEPVDSDPDPVTGIFSSFPSRGTPNLKVDAGFIPLHTIGDFVWEDTDADGIQDVGEPGVENATIILKQWDGTTFNLAGVQNTDANGAYEFSDLVPGDYRIHVTAPSEFGVFTASGQGGDPFVDSNIDPQTGESDTITIDANFLAGASVDVGLVPPNYAEIIFFEDVDGDGTYSAGDVGAGIPVELYKDNVSYTTDIPNESALIVRGPLPSGQYHVQVDPAAVSALGFAFVGGLDIDPATGQSAPVSVVAGETIQFTGAVRAGLPTGRFIQVVNDSPDINELTISLDGQEVVSGLEFREASQLIPLGPGTVTLGHGTLTVESPVDWQTGSWILPETDDEVLVISGMSGSTDRPIVGLNKYQMNGADGAPTPSIIQDVLDSVGALDVEVTIRTGETTNTHTFSLAYGESTGPLNLGTSGGSTDISISIDDDSHFAELSIPRNSPAPTAILLSGYLNSGPDKPEITVVAAHVDASVVVYRREEALITGQKWFDYNADGIWDPLEPVVEGQIIQLIHPSGAIETKLTDANGRYSFEPLGAGTYTVKEAPAPGWTQTWPTTNGYTLTIGNEGIYAEKDFGNYTSVPNAQVTGLKFNDLNANGERDAGEPGIAGWQFEATSVATDDVFSAMEPGITTTATTAADGTFVFELPPGRYGIREVAQDDWIKTMGGVPSSASTWASPSSDDNVDMNITVPIVPEGPVDITDPALTYGNHNQGAVFQAGLVPDAGDLDPSDGVCDDGTGNCPLRAAIQQLFSSGGPGTIQLVGGSNKKKTVIELQSPLPAITSPVVITGDGSVTLDGTNAGFGANGLVINSSGVAISGIGIENFSGHGVLIEGGERAVVENNSIASNGGDGVRIMAGNGHTISGNALFGNTGLPIDLGGDGQTSNDFDDSDFGVNELQNYPSLSRAWPGTVTVEGTLRAAPFSTVTVDFFYSDTCRAGLVPEASVFAGSREIHTDLSGSMWFRATLDVESSTGGYVSATTTASTGSTSEFSDCLWVGEVPFDVGTDEPEPEIPETVTLHQNYPNPFNPLTQVAFELPASMTVRLEVFDLLGRRVSTLINETRAAGRHEVSFDASRLSSGMYFYRLSSEAFVLTKQMVLLK